MDNKMIEKEKIIKIIKDWFQNNSGGGLVTPDGWFGRPYDNIHMLTYLEVRPNKVILELDEQLYLIFTNLKSVYTKDNDLCFEEFSQCVFDWQGYGDLKPNASLFRSGTIKIVALPGA